MLEGAVDPCGLVNMVFPNFTSSSLLHQTVSVEEMAYGLEWVVPETKDVLV